VAGLDGGTVKGAESKTQSEYHPDNSQIPQNLQKKWLSALIGNGLIAMKTVT
jgi:hypothetical protein